MGRFIIEETEKFVKEYLENVEPGHNWWHIFRVRQLALYIFSAEEKGDPYVIELAALLHDVGDNKIDKRNNGPLLVRNFLNRLGLGTENIDKITCIMEHISFRDSFKRLDKKLPELDIVQDADRLDALGAIGIARTFSYSGSKNFEIYTPGEEAADYKSSLEYESSRSSTINHFYEKLLKLKDMMNTNTGRKLAEERHSYMEDFLRQFYREWDIGLSPRPVHPGNGDPAT